MIRAEIMSDHRFHSFADQRSRNFVKWCVDILCRSSPLAESSDSGISTGTITCGQSQSCFRGRRSPSSSWYVPFLRGCLPVHLATFGVVMGRTPVRDVSSRAVLVSWHGSSPDRLQRAVLPNSIKSPGMTSCSCPRVLDLHHAQRSKVDSSHSSPHPLFHDDTSL